MCSAPLLQKSRLPLGLCPTPYTEQQLELWIQLSVGSSIQQPRFDPVPAAIFVACQTARASCLTAGAAKHTAEASSDAVDATEMDGCDQEPLLEPRAAGGTETTLPQPPREPPAGFTKPLPTSLEPLSRLLELEAGTVADIAGAAAGIAGTASSR